MVRILGEAVMSVGCGRMAGWSRLAPVWAVHVETSDSLKRPGPATSPIVICLPAYSAYLAYMKNGMSMQLWNVEKNRVPESGVTPKTWHFPTSQITQTLFFMQLLPSPNKIRADSSTYNLGLTHEHSAYINHLRRPRSRAQLMTRPPSY